MLTNIHNAPEEGNFCYEAGKAIKLQIVMDYNHHMGCVDKAQHSVSIQGEEADPLGDAYSKSIQ